MPTRISDEADSNSQYLSKLNSYYVNQTGDTMTGELNMNSNKIVNLVTPSSSGDAVNKGYVDSKFPKIYNFTLAKDVTPEDKVVTITIFVPNGVNPNRVYLEASHPCLKTVSVGVALTSSHSPTEVDYRLEFTLANQQRRGIYLDGKIYIFPLEPIRLLGSSVVNLVNDTPVATLKT